MAWLKRVWQHLFRIGAAGQPHEVSGLTYAPLPGVQSRCCQAVVTVGPVEIGHFSVWTPLRCTRCGKVLEMIGLGRVNRANEVCLN